MEILDSNQCSSSKAQQSATTTGEQFCSADPTYYQTLIDSVIEIETIDGKIHMGKVHVIDPVSRSIVTTQVGDETTKINIFPGHAIKRLEVGDIKYPRSPPSMAHYNKTPKVAEESLLSRKEAVKHWLGLNLVEFEEDGMSLKVGDDLVIEPPYDIEQCYSSNTIILQRVQDLLTRMYLGKKEA